MIQSAVLGSLSVVIGGDVAGLDKAARQAENIVGKLTGRLNSNVTALATYASVAAAAGAALAAGLVAKSLETIDAQSKLAAKLNGSVAELQALVHAGDLAGVSQEQLATAIGKMGARLAEAARTGQGPAYEALQRLGLSAKEFIALPVNERMAALADKFKELGYNTAQQADALKQLGVRGQELISLFEGGGDQIREAAKDVEAFGVATSDIDAATVEAANDAWTTARLLLTGIGNQLAVNLAPIIKQIGDDFADAGRETHGFADAIEGGVRQGVLLFGKLQSSIQQNRIEVDEFIADVIRLFDNVAGLTPRLLAGLSGNLLTAADLGFREIEHNFGQLRSKLGPPANDADWEAWLTSIKQKAREASEQVVAERKKANAGSADTGDGMSDSERKAQQDKLDRLKRSIASEDEQLRMARDEQLRDLDEFLQKKIIKESEAAGIRLQIEDKYRKDLAELVRSKLEESVATEDELLANKYAKQLADLQTFENNKTITVEQAEALRRKIQDKARLASIQLQAAQYSALAGIVDSSMSEISSLVDSEGNKQFAIFKAISVATALVKGYEAVVSAYAAGSKIGGPAVGTAFAAIAAAGVAAHIAKLVATNPGSGGGGGAVTAGGGGGDAGAAASASQAQASPQQSLFLTVQGNFFGREQVRELAGKLIDFQNDGGKVVLR